MSVLQFVTAALTIAVAFGSVPDFQQINATEIESKIKAVLLTLRNKQNDTNEGGIPGMQLLDPMQIPDSTSEVDITIASGTLHLYRSQISGLSNFTLHQISANLGQLQVSIAFNFTNIRTSGSYNLNGVTGWWKPISYSGPYEIDITDVDVWGTIRMKVSEDGRLEIQEVDLDCSLIIRNLHFENLPLNYVINALSSYIFDTVKPAILEQLTQIVKDSINEQLKTFPDHTLLQWSSSPLDVIIANTAAEIRNRRMDPYELPAQTFQLDRNVFFLKIYGEATLHKGYFKGLSSMYRTGDATMSFKNNTFEISVNLGFKKLAGGYRWQASAMGISKKGGLHFKVKNINILLTLKQINEAGKSPEIKDFDIKVGQLAMDMDGLGSLDWLMEFFANFVTNVFQTQFAHVLQSKIKDIFEKQVNLNKVHMPF